MDTEEEKDEGLGIWNFIHGTGAGCASIFAWEALRHTVAGGILFVFYGGATIVIMHVVHRHRKHIKEKRAARTVHRRGRRPSRPTGTHNKHQ